MLPFMYDSSHSLHLFPFHRSHFHVLPLQAGSFLEFASWLILEMGFLTEKTHPPIWAYIGRPPSPSASCSVLSVLLASRFLLHALSFSLHLTALFSPRSASLSDYEGRSWGKLWEHLGGWAVVKPLCRLSKQCQASYFRCRKTTKHTQKGKIGSVYC